MLVYGACNGKGAYFLTKVGSLIESELCTASGFMFNMFSSSTAAASLFWFLNNFEFWILWRTFVIFGIILHAMNSRILIKKKDESNGT